jgi:hypothetical protein
LANAETHGGSASVRRSAHPLHTPGHSDVSRGSPSGTRSDEESSATVDEWRVYGLIIDGRSGREKLDVLGGIELIEILLG